MKKGRASMHFDMMYWDLGRRYNGVFGGIKKEVIEAFVIDTDRIIEFRIMRVFGNTVRMTLNIPRQH